MSTRITFERYHFMVRHFLLSPKSRDMSLRKALGMFDEEARNFFAEFRWGQLRSRHAHTAVP